MIHIHDPDVLFEEAAFVAYHFGWGREDVLEMPHWERQRWCEEISEINEQMNSGGGRRTASQPEQQTANFLDTEDGGKVLSKSLDEFHEE